MESLKKNNLLGNRDFVLNIILDGVAISPRTEGDSFKAAHKPIFDFLKKNYLYREIYAHGTYVGLPSNQEMGNSEVGHNAIGSGKIYTQGAKLVNQSIKDNSIFAGETWKNIIDYGLKNKSTIHFLGLVSDGYVHSHTSHFMALAEKSCKDGIKKIFLHAILDGRDVHPDSSIEYLEKIEEFFKQLEKKYQVEAKIVSVGGRMLVFMDRYGSDWGMIEKGWRMMVEGEALQNFKSPIEGIKHLKKKNYTNDQYVEPFLVFEDKPITVDDGDIVVLFNYRGDRAIEISRAFDEETLPYFKKNKHPKVFFAGITLYDGDLQIPKKFLVSPPHITDTMGEYLVKSNLAIFAISETQKYGHVTYFWNGNRSEKFSKELEEYFEIKSDNVPFDQRPWMKAAEITDLTIEQIKKKQFKFGRINYPNGDMVGHTGDFNASRMAVEAVDICLGRLIKEIEKNNGIAIITADHGNCDEMYQIDNDGKVLKDKSGNLILKTSHTLNPVPMIIYDPLFQEEYKLADNPDAGIANLAATSLNLMGFVAPDDYQPSLIEFNI